MFVTYLKTIGIGDVLDVALVSILIYALLMWFKRARAAIIVKGMIVTGAVYLLARVVGMVMTIMLFHAFFAILALALVVIFQEELRRVFERIAVWSLSGGKVWLSASPDSDVIASAVDELARERTGALIVLAGRDPLDRHLQGGWTLSGTISEPLLTSIFDRHSSGHDGAVIVEEQRVTHFGCRLPLSRDVEKTRSVGTRHAAALGLAELTDALCIVVSEERGTISIARDSHLHPVTDHAALKEEIQRFTEDMRPQPTAQRLRALRTRNSFQKAVALSASVLIWLVFVFGLKKAEHEFEVPVTLRDVPENLQVVRVLPETIRVTAGAQIRDFFSADSAPISIRLDLAAAREGVNRFTLGPTAVSRPVTFALADIHPTVIEVEFERVRSGAGVAPAVPDPERP